MTAPDERIIQGPNRVSGQMAATALPLQGLAGACWQERSAAQWRACHKGHGFPASLRACMGDGLPSPEALATAGNPYDPSRM